ncbi:MAG: ribosomal-processing cysteine protease Prp [Blautia massiliensis (ex Durand et al. 2017)]
MITIKVRKKNGSYEEFISKGHAGYAEAGQDIVCAAVSALIITTVNSLEKFTDDTSLMCRTKDGSVYIHLTGNDLLNGECS